MTPRSIRRAQERKAAKAARRAANQAALPGCPEPLAAEPRALASGRLTAATSEARLAANRANALLSTGPVSEAGKSVSCLNAVKTGLTGRTVLLHSDDAEAYRRHVAAYQNEYRPVALRECELVQSLADTQWRLNRIPALEMAIYAQGHIEFAADFEEHPAGLRPAMIELQTHTKYEKQLRNLHIQEARLVRRYQKEMAELRGLQDERLASNLELPAAEDIHQSGQPSRPAAHAAQAAFDATPASRDLQAQSDLSPFTGAMTANQLTIECPNTAWR